MNRQSSNNNRRVRWRWLLRWKRALNPYYKNNNSRNFQFTKFSFIDFVLTDRRSLSGKRPKSASGKSSGCRYFHHQPREILTPKPPNTQLSVFLLECWFSSPLRKVWISLSVNLYWESWRLCRSFINLTEWRQRLVTCKQPIGYINTRE